MNSLYSLIFALLFAHGANAVEFKVREGVDFSKLDKYQKIYSLPYLASRIHNVFQHPTLDKDEIGKYLKWGEAGLTIMANPNEEPALAIKTNYFLEYGGHSAPTESVNCFKKSRNPFRPLKGLKVALDPGHIGGKFSKLEKKYVLMDGGRIDFNEGDLNYYTALKLKLMLERAGAEVFMTRGKESAALGSFDDWFSIDKNIMDAYDSWRLAKFGAHKDAEGRLADIALFKAERETTFYVFFGREEMRKRADLINEFNPDFTLLIHYNGYPGEYNRQGVQTRKTRDEHGQNVGTNTQNYNMLFVPGSFMKNELNEKHTQFHFLKLLLDNKIIDGSIDLCTDLLGSVMKKFKDLKTADYGDPYYTADVSLPIVKKDGQQLRGIFHRNLDMLRFLNAPSCYMELFVQDNFEEAEILNTNNAKLKQHRVPKKILNVARSYFKGIKKYFKAKTCK
ncbi:MAG: hypothetical protein HOE90_12025 [Bacteriovoracaceae bacterium]|jgi:N-acetylmuramoyl-L-alanine amidase|nr:hypothetical protein [Bacteriovoracaceae bacterium]